MLYGLKLWEWLPGRSFESMASRQAIYIQINRMMTKKITFYKVGTGLFVSVWIILWGVFSIKEYKAGQFANIVYCYNHDKMNDKNRYLYGDDLYDFLIYVKKKLPHQGTYELKGSISLDMDGMRTRYFLWPLKRSSQDPDFIVCFRPTCPEGNGYRILDRYKGVGVILVRERSL